VLSISSAIDTYLDNVFLSRSENTHRAYKNGLSLYCEILKDNDIDPEEQDITGLSEDPVSWYATALKEYSPATEQLYLTAVVGFYEFLAAENLAAPNLHRVRLLVRQRARRPGKRLPQFPKSDILHIIDYYTTLSPALSEDSNARLRQLRDRAFILVLADTGLRVHEACGMRRGDIDWDERKAIVIGKGDRQSVVRFSSRAIRAIRAYLSARAELDGISGRPLPSLPVFARHDKGAGKKVKPITPTTGRNIVTHAVKTVLGPEAAGTITPHSFRHYFVTTVLRGSGGNLKLAQELARHKNIQVTQRYAHLSDDELDQGYHEIFENE
jgi:site-specific recombinase XerD